jgi:hypothetical protein
VNLQLSEAALGFAVEIRKTFASQKLKASFLLCLNPFAMGPNY